MDGQRPISTGSNIPGTQGAHGDNNVDSNQGSVAFTRKTTAIADPDLKMNGLHHPQNMPSKKLIDRNPSHLTRRQKFQLGLLLLGSWLIRGEKGRSWLAEKALGLMDKAVRQNDQSVAAELQGLINEKLSPLSEHQLARFNQQCQHFHPLTPLAPDADKKPSNLTFMTWMYKLYEGEHGAKAFRLMAKQFFDGASHQVLTKPVEDMATKEDLTGEDIAGTFAEVALDAVDETNDPGELVKIQTMLNSVFKQYPGAGKCEHALEKIAEKLRQ